MSLLKEYEELEKLRKEDGEKCAKHYNSLNLPGDRVVTATGNSDAKERIKQMKAKQEGQLYWKK